MLAMASAGGGVMHGAAMSQGLTWKPAHVTDAIYKSLIPTASKEARSQ